MIIGSGIDIIENDRIKKACQNTSFITKVFTEKEISILKNRKNNYQSFAGNFAAKEAVSKALGTGFGKVGWRDIEILRNSHGKPYVILHGEAKKVLQELGGGRIWISISHCINYAIAHATIECGE